MLPLGLVQYCSQHSCIIADFFSSCLVSVQVVHPYGSLDTTAAWKKLRFILSVRSDFQHPTRHQLYGHLPPITKTIQVRRTRHARHSWRSRGELISDVLLLTPTNGRAKARRPARTYIQQLCEDMGFSPEDQPEAMNDWEKWRERVRDILASGTTLTHKQDRTQDQY